MFLFFFHWKSPRFLGIGKVNIMELDSYPLGFNRFVFRSTPSRTAFFCGIRNTGHDLYSERIMLVKKTSSTFVFLNTKEVFYNTVRVFNWKKILIDKLKIRNFQTAVFIEVSNLVESLSCLDCCVCKYKARLAQWLKKNLTQRLKGYF